MDTLDIAVRLGVAPVILGAAAVGGILGGLVAIGFEAFRRVCVGELGNGACSAPRPSS